jgi:hypothetical protein
MIFTDYYKGENLPGNSKTRYDVTSSTGSYEYFETKLRNKKGGLTFYFSDVPVFFKFASKERPDKTISKGENISSVFVPDPTAPNGYGDIYQTQDAIIILFSKDYKVIEIFIARGQRNNRINLYFLQGHEDIQNEFETLRNRAKPC